MIVRLEKFIDEERPVWDALAAEIHRIQEEPEARLTFEEVEKLNYLYQRTAAGAELIKANSFNSGLHAELEKLVSSAYSELNAPKRGSFGLWERFKTFFAIFPRTVRKWRGSLVTSVLLTLAGCIAGMGLLASEPAVKEYILPFPHLLQSPSDRVAKEETMERGAELDTNAIFSATLMTHNTRVAILLLALGMTFGIGTGILLFYNGVILGAVGYDYIQDGQMEFLFAWLLPHGSVEIPAIILAGQAGLILARALIGFGDTQPLHDRMRSISGDLIILISGIALMLVWAGLVESFLSQLHAPLVPYSMKIALGSVELVALIAYFALAGKIKPVKAGAAS